MKWKLAATFLLIAGGVQTVCTDVLHAEPLPALTQKVHVLVDDLHTKITDKKEIVDSVATSSLTHKMATKAHTALHSQMSSPTTAKKEMSGTTPASATVQKQDVLLQVPAQAQNPDLYNGCEITSLSMLLTAAGHPVDKMTLANQIAKDQTPEVLNSDGSIASWGDPNNGFVGDITGGNPGYGVYHRPIANLLNQVIPGRALDLTGDSFDRIEHQLSAGKPVVMWTTANFAPTDSWVTWQGPNGSVRATFDEHVVLLVGYNQNQLFINDPLDGTTAKAVDRTSFLSAWEQLGQQAVSFS